MTEPIDTEYAAFLMNECFSIEFACETCIHKGICLNIDYQKKNSNLNHRGCESYYPSADEISQAVEAVKGRVNNGD